MAGVPPDTIHIKRKRGDDDPVDFLQFERGKRSRSQSGGGDTWVYQRRRVSAKAVSLAAPSVLAIPTIQATQEGDENPLAKTVHRKPQPTLLEAAPQLPQQPAPPVSTRPAPEHIRRFHLSRSDSPQLSAGISKKRTAPAVFVERDAKKQRESLRAVLEQHHVAPSERPKAQVNAQAARPAAPKDEEPRPVQPESSAAKTSPKLSASRPAAPVSMPDRKNKDLDEMARLMDSWTLDLIAQDREKMEQKTSTAKYNPATSKFKPRAPKLRYFERHPESVAAKERESAAQQPAAATPPATDGNVVDMTDDNNDDDYVLETYERVPAERLLDQAVPAHRVGLLVFDSEPDMAQFFYGNESDSEDGFAEDDDDSNDENFYANEYPDEDLASDDEFDRDPYQYRNQNASDLEEFDEREFDAEQDAENAWTDKVWDRAEKLQGQPGWD